jgi:hypothetical protein
MESAGRVPRRGPYSSPRPSSDPTRPDPTTPCGRAHMRFVSEKKIGAILLRRLPQRSSDRLIELCAAAACFPGPREGGFDFCGVLYGHKVGRARQQQPQPQQRQHAIDRSIMRCCTPRGSSSYACATRPLRPRPRRRRPLCGCWPRACAFSLLEGVVVRCTGNHHHATLGGGAGGTTGPVCPSLSVEERLCLRKRERECVCM